MLSFSARLGSSVPGRVERRDLVVYFWLNRASPTQRQTMYDCRYRPQARTSASRSVSSSWDRVAHVTTRETHRRCPLGCGPLQVGPGCHSR